MSVSGVAHARRASFQQSAVNDWNRMNQVAAEVTGHSCVSEITHGHTFTFTQAFHTRRRVPHGGGVCARGLEFTPPFFPTGAIRRGASGRRDGRKYRSPPRHVMGAYLQVGDKLLIHAEQEPPSHRIAVPLVGARVRVPGCRKASGPSGPRAIDNLVSVGVRVVRRTVGAGAAPAAESDVVNVAFFANPRSLRQGS